MLIVLTTVPDRALANTLADSIVRERLAACVQILPKMTSVYFWEGEIRKEPEFLLLIKTLGSKFGELEEFIKAKHSYDVPEIVAFESSNTSGSYKAWLENYLLS